MASGDASFPFEFTSHAQRVIEERELELEWVRRAMERPGLVEPNGHDPALRHALARVPERGDRVLRVIYNNTTQPWRIVTAYFDRRMRGRL